MAVSGFAQAVQDRGAGVAVRVRECRARRTPRVRAQVRGVLVLARAALRTESVGLGVSGVAPAVLGSLARGWPVCVVGTRRAACTALRVLEGAGLAGHARASVGAGVTLVTRAGSHVRAGHAGLRVRWAARTRGRGGILARLARLARAAGRAVVSGVAQAVGGGGRAHARARVRRAEANRLVGAEGVGRAEHAGIIH